MLLQWVRNARSQCIKFLFGTESGTQGKGVNEARWPCHCSSV